MASGPPRRRHYPPVTDSRLRSPADHSKTAGHPRSHKLFKCC
jgi:hypothetical protein